MALDNNLRLADAASPITGAGALAAIDTEGGFRADVEFYLGVITDANETFDLDVEASVDNGANYFPILTMEQFTNDEEGTATVRNKISRPVFVPPPTNPANKTKVRINVRAVGGTTPSLPLDAWLVPLMSLAPPDADRAAGLGLYKLFT